jgi:hypothetical protein
VKRKLQTLDELRQLQRLAGAVIMRPLTNRWSMQKTWTDDRDIREVVGEFIKPNDRLTSAERIEIYNKQYWFRLVDSLYDDFPGLRAVLGRLKFNKLILKYIDENPSRSFTMRNLGRNMVSFLESHPELTQPRFDLALDMARFEWGQIIAFDDPAYPPLSVDDLLGQNPAKLKLSIQPHVVLLHLRFPLDDFAIQLKQNSLRGQASNAMEEKPGAEADQKASIALPKRSEIFLAIHRYDNSLFYKRLDREAYQLLIALKAGKTLAKALVAAFDDVPDAERIKKWFETWTSLGWFCKPPSSK